MTSDRRFSLLRNILRAFGLSEESSQEIIDWILDLLSAKSTEKVKKLPYASRDDFLSKAELAFYLTLRMVIRNRLIICPKIGLKELFFVTEKDNSQNRIYLNKIDRKHVDFVLCDPHTMNPVLGIELDDKSHQKAARQERDVFVNEVFESAGLPLLRIPAKRDYSTEDLKTLLIQYVDFTPPAQAESPVAAAKAQKPARTETSAPVPIKKQPESAEKPVQTVSRAAPESRTCPKCGGDMILRTAAKGANKGNQFWGCSNYPQCRTMLAHQP